MGTYIVLSQINAAGLRNLKAHPERFDEVAAEIASMDGKVVDQWATLGPFDVCSIVSAPDNAAMQRMQVEGTRNGRVKYTVLPAIDLPLFVRLLGQTTETTGPHRWQTRWWAQLARRAMRYRTVTRHVREACKPLTIEGQENLKGEKGPFIFISNHSSHLDSYVVQAAMPERFRRRVAFGSAADRWFLKDVKGITRQGWYASLSQNCFPIQRGGGPQTLDYSKDLLDKGWSLMIFPEGTRSATGKMGKFRYGAAGLALEKNVGVVPIYMEGLSAIRPKGSRVITPGAVTARIGKPIRFAPGTTASDATRQMFQAMDAMRRDLHRHRGADRVEEAATESAPDAAPAG